MDKLFVVIKREFMERIRNRWFVIMTLLMPAIMAALVLLGSPSAAPAPTT